MPWSYRYDAAAEVLITTATGVLSESELVSGMQRLCADPQCQGSVRIFGDYSTVDRFDVTEEGVRPRLPPDWLAAIEGRCAVLMFQPLGSANFRRVLDAAKVAHGRVFAERRAALEWINEGVPDGRRLTLEATMAALPRPAFGLLADLDRARSIRANRPPGDGPSGAPFH